MKILINIVIIIFDHKIKIKNDETLDKTFNEILIKNHVIFVDSLNETAVDQEAIFLAVNVITTKKQFLL
jgi:hypothetical protein